MRELARAALLLLAALACGAETAPRHVILISVDTLRADRLGTYGYSLPTSPALDSLAQAGVVFEDASSTAPWTLPAHATLFTGLYPSRHGVVTARHALDRQLPTLAEILAERGYETRAIVNGYWLKRLGRGFGRYLFIGGSDRPEGAAPLITDTAIRWLELERNQPLLLFLHYFDVHSDYRPLPRYQRMFAPPPGRIDGSTDQLVAVNRGEIQLDAADLRRLALLYDAGIRQLDDELARLFHFLRSEGWLERSYVIVTSDHGEEFLEHGGVLHTRTHYREILRVPLIWLGPDLPAGVRVATPVSLVDVFPTLLGLLGIPAPGSDGTDLRPLWERADGGWPERPLFAETGPGLFEDQRRSVRRGRYKLIVDTAADAAELYDLAADPGEQRNLSADRPELVNALAADLERLGEQRLSAPLAPPPPPEVREQLRALGYVE